jgi:hypothetical protein
MKKQLTAFLSLSALLIGCATLGSKTLYKSDTSTRINTIGFTTLDGDSVVSKIFSETSNVFEKTVFETFHDYRLYDIKPIDTQLSIVNSDTSKIAKICQENNLDALVVSRLTFIHTTYSVDFIPVAKNYDTEVTMKLFDKSGKLIVAVSHNTYKGNSYMTAPTARRTIHDGTEGAIRKMVKELGLTK